MSRNPLHSICPYFAMFPEDFVRTHLETYTKRGDVVFDCFSGRGTTLLEALLNGRFAAAIDVNPVAFCISGAKAEIPDYGFLGERLDDLEFLYRRTRSSILEHRRQELPRFFRRAFHAATLRQLIFLKAALRWRASRTDRFLAALVLGSLHGEMLKSQSYFSNQMPRTISTKPAYSLKYWDDNDLWPKKRNVFAVLRDRAELRYSGRHPPFDGRAVMGDARNSGVLLSELHGCVRAVITSPPYFDVTNFEEDQWLRLWFLGNDPHPTYGQISRDDRYRRQADRSAYWDFLAAVWKGMKPLLHSSAVIVCRLGAKGISQPILTRQLRQSIQAAFPKAELARAPVRSELKNRQRERFQPGTEGCLFEVDYVFSI
jgi:hypothetical protein